MQRGEADGRKITLSEGEWKLMNLLWVDFPKSIMQMVADMKEETGWEKHTIIVMLKRLEEKGAVSYVTEGRTKMYSPAVKQREVVRDETRRFLEKVYQGSLSRMLTAMVKQERFSEEELEELRAILQTDSSDRADT